MQRRICAHLIRQRSGASRDPETLLRGKVTDHQHHITPGFAGGGARLLPVACHIVEGQLDDLVISILQLFDHGIHAVRGHGLLLQGL